VDATSGYDDMWSLEVGIEKKTGHFIFFSGSKKKQK